MKKSFRFLSLFLFICLCFTNFSTTTLASDGNDVSSNDYIVVTDGTNTYSYPATVDETTTIGEDGANIVERAVFTEIKFNENGELLNPNARVSGYDSSYSCYANLITQYTAYSDSTIKIYSVEGFRSVVDPTVQVYGQHVHVEYNGYDGNYYNDFYPTASTWNYNVNFPRVYMYGAIYGSQYTVTLGRQDASRTWSFTISDVVNNAS